MNFNSSGPFRILILGLPGSGKSTLAKNLSKHLKIRHIECDQFFWTGDRVQVARKDFLHKIAQEIKADSFVIEGHFKDIKELLHQDTLTHVLWLDPDFKTVLWRLFKRERTQRGFAETFSSKGTFRFFLKNHPRLRKMQAQAFADFKTRSSLVTARLKNSREILNF